MTEERTTSTDPAADAQKNYDAACRAYEKIVNVPTKTMKPADRQAHDRKARKALSDKRYAAAVLEARLHNRPVPKREDLVECAL